MTEIKEPVPSTAHKFLLSIVLLIVPVGLMVWLAPPGTRGIYLLAIVTVVITTGVVVSGKLKFNAIKVAVLSVGSWILLTSALYLFDSPRRYIASYLYLDRGFELWKDDLDQLPIWINQQFNNAYFSFSVFVAILLGVIVGGKFVIDYFNPDPDSLFTEDNDGP